MLLSIKAHFLWKINIWMAKWTRLQHCESRRVVCRPCWCNFFILHVGGEIDCKEKWNIWLNLFQSDSSRSCYMFRPTNWSVCKGVDRTTSRIKWIVDHRCFAFQRWSTTSHMDVEQCYQQNSSFSRAKLETKENHGESIF